MIQLKNVEFSYKKGNPVFSDLSMEIGEGRICGLLGSNGAGKSTLLYLVMGLLRPKAGEASVDGMVSHKRQAEMLSNIFLVPEEFSLPGMDLKTYIGLLKPFYPDFSEDLLTRCLADFGLTPDLNLGQLSMGQKKKVYICVALATNTKYLLMDEPTNGLDIASKSQFRKVVVTGMSDQKTILISTHQVHDVEKLLDHVIILDQSQVLYDAPLEEADDAPVDLEKLYIDVLNNKIS